MINLTVSKEELQLIIDGLYVSREEEKHYATINSKAKRNVDKISLLIKFFERKLQ